MVGLLTIALGGSLLALFISIGVKISDRCDRAFDIHSNPTFNPPYIYEGLFDDERRELPIKDHARVPPPPKPTPDQIPMSGYIMGAGRVWFRDQTKDMPHNVETCQDSYCKTCGHYLNDLIAMTSGR